MRSIPDATAITLTELERAELESLARSMKGEHRLRLRARIILLASDGAATRADRRERLAARLAQRPNGGFVTRQTHRLVGFSYDTGERGAEA